MARRDDQGSAGQMTRREAILGSIAKWDGIVAGTEEDLGSQNCPLCQQYLRRGDGDMCEGCPVRERTGLPGCNGTPYTEYYEIMNAAFTASDQRMSTKRIRRLPEVIDAARRELDFLRSLLGG